MNPSLMTHFITHSSHLGASQSTLSAFKLLKKPNLLSQNLTLKSLCKDNLYKDALYIYRKCRILGCSSDHYTFPLIIKSCSVLNEVNLAREVHGIVIKNGFQSNVVVKTALIDFYSKINDISNAYTLLDELSEPDSVAYNALISGCSYNGLDKEAFNVFKEMFLLNLKPNDSTFASIIPVYSRLGNFENCKSLHSLVVKTGYYMDENLTPAFISMYANNNDLSIAKNIFNRSSKKITICNSIISACNKNHEPYYAFKVFRELVRDGKKPNMITFVSIIPSCENLSSVLYGESLHSSVIKYGYENESSILTSLLSMYGKLGDVDSAEYIFKHIPNPNILSYNSLLAFYSNCGDLSSSLKLFNKMVVKNIVSWNTMLSSCINNEEITTGLSIFRQMIKQNVGFDSITLKIILPFCKNETLGMCIHGYVTKSGFLYDVALANSLITMYFNCRELEYANLVFEEMPMRSLVTWNALMTGYRNLNLLQNVMTLFNRMVNENQKVNYVTLINILPACYKRAHGKAIHAYAIKARVNSETETETNLLTSLMLMYTRFNDMKSCMTLFYTRHIKTLSIWNAIISALVHSGNLETALIYFVKSLREIKPDYVTVLSIVSSCNSLEFSDSLYGFLIKKGFDKDTAIINALIDKYTKCGGIFVAKKLFRALVKKDVFSWSVMINCYALHGDGESALNLLHEMRVSGFKPDDVTYLSVLSGCNHGGLVEEAKRVFSSMICDGILPRKEHYGCLVSVLSRAGYLDEAYGLLKSLPMKLKPLDLVESLMGACLKYGNVELGEEISKWVIGNVGESSGAYVILHNIYAAAGRWSDANKVRSEMEEKQLMKIPGVSLVN